MGFAAAKPASARIVESFMVEEWTVKTGVMAEKVVAGESVSFVGWRNAVKVRQVRYHSMGSLRVICAFRDHEVRIVGLAS